MAKPVWNAKARQSIAEFLKKTLKHVYSQTEIIEFKGLAVPISIAKVDAKTRYHGYRQETRTESALLGGPVKRCAKRSWHTAKSYQNAI